MCTFIFGSSGSFIVIKACSSGRLTRSFIGGLSSWKPWRLRRCVVSTWLRAETDCDGYHALHGSPSHVWWTTRVFTVRTLMFIQSASRRKSLWETFCLAAVSGPWNHVNSYSVTTKPAGVTSLFLCSLKSLYLQLSSLTCVSKALSKTRLPFKGESLLVCSLPGRVVYLCHVSTKSRIYCKLPDQTVWTRRLELLCFIRDARL